MKKLILGILACSLLPCTAMAQQAPVPMFASPAGVLSAKIGATYYALGTCTTGSACVITGTPIATSSSFGTVKPDNTSITISGGIITATGVPATAGPVLQLLSTMAGGL